MKKEPIRLSFSPVCETKGCIRPRAGVAFCRECLEESVREEIRKFTEGFSALSTTKDRISAHDYRSRGIHKVSLARENMV